MKYYNPDTHEFITPGQARIKYGTVPNETAMNRKGFYEVVDPYYNLLDSEILKRHMLKNGNSGYNAGDLFHYGPLVKNGNKVYRTMFPTVILIELLCRLGDSEGIPTAHITPDGTKKYVVSVDNSGSLTTTEDTDFDPPVPAT